jgi:hypothetical protein
MMRLLETFANHEHCGGGDLQNADSQAPVIPAQVATMAC